MVPPGIRDGVDRSGSLSRATAQRFGSLFLEEVESAIDLIGRNPSAARAWHRDTRRHVLQRFRYTIRYRVRTDQDTIDFLSIVHTSRHPSTGLDR